MNLLTSQSKFLSLLLRHDPGILNLLMDVHGWVYVQDLIDNSKGNRTAFTKEVIEHIVATDEKQRYAFNDDRTKIRANQGHSMKDIDVELEPATPPKYLYHGTGSLSLPSIKLNGLKKMNRQHVHLSSDEVTAKKIGSRHGVPAVLRVLSGDMYCDEFEHVFYKSKNGVWLIDNVPIKYIQIIPYKKTSG